MPKLLLFLSIACALPLEATAQTRVLRQPDISATQIVFTHGGDLWISAREGGLARRLTSFAGVESHPQFSPDGSLVAFSGQYDGNTDVYVVASAGGEPQRLTWHPLADTVCAFAPDGKSVLFSSGRINAPRANPRLWTIGLDAAMAEALPLDRASYGVFSPDKKRVAYRVVAPWDDEWRNYRGGQTAPVRVVELSSLQVEELPWETSKDVDPIWIGDTIYFLSDRDLAMNVWAFDCKSKELQQRTHFREFDCKQLAGGHGALVFENGGYLWTLDLASGEPRQLSIQVEGDFPHARPHWEEVGDQALSASLSPSGKRVLFEARGEIFAVPAEKGDTRNLTRASGSAERAASWSPDGKTVAWFSDAGGEYELVLANAHGDVQRRVEMQKPSFPYTPQWSPDSKHLSYGDADRDLWLLEVESGKARKIDNEGSAHPTRWLQAAWSPDSKWIAYSRHLENQFNGVFLYSLQSGTSTQLSDGLSDAFRPVFDAGGKYLYFLASTDYALDVAWLDMSSLGRPPHYNIYCAVLSDQEASPRKPQSDEEEATAAQTPKDEEKDEKQSEAIEVRIDLTDLARRIVALEIPARSYVSLHAGVVGTFFYTESEDPFETSGALYRYDMEKREESQVTGGVSAYSVSADGKKLLYRSNKQWTLIDADGKPDESTKPLDLSGLRLLVDPPAEWAQMFREAWRFQRDYFYVENVHGLDLDWAWKAYSPWIEHIRHRDDLNYVLDILGGETCVGHSFTAGGDMPTIDKVPVGLLGADLEIANGRYRIRKIYTGESWNPDLAAPLSGPGLNVNVGDYILAVDGEPVVAARNFYSYFDRRADRQTRLMIHDRPSVEGAREIVVVPIASDAALRQRDWVEQNRRRVDELSGGKLGYVWVPDTGDGGYTSFNRYFFAQMDKQGVVIDERFNNGGLIADYIVELCSRKLMGFFSNPVGERKPWTAPNAAIWGPKIMLINEMSGSGGDMLPYMFRQLSIGPLVGTRTWGGLVGIWDVPDLVDGGFITAPRGGFYNLEGDWDVEGEGITPDVVVEQTPRGMRDGGDPQLEAAVRIALEALERESIRMLPQPRDPIRSLRPETQR